MVSTVAPSVDAVLAMGSLPAKLAFSLHSAVDDTRKLMVPTATASTADLQAAWIETLKNRSSFVAPRYNTTASGLRSFAS